MPLDEFNNVLAGLIQGFAKKLKASASDRPAHIALIIQPTQWRADDRKFVDHTAEMIRRVKLPIVQRIQAPYSSQQYNAQMVDWAKEHREFLVLSREVTVWRCD
jgi:adenine-specific DNA methylase